MLYYKPSNLYCTPISMTQCSWYLMYSSLNTHLSACHLYLVRTSATENRLTDERGVDVAVAKEKEKKKKVTKEEGNSAAQLLHYSPCESIV